MEAKKPKAKVYVFETRDSRKARLLGVTVPFFKARIAALTRQVEDVKNVRRKQ